MVHKAGQQMSHQLGSGDDAWSDACGFPRVPLYGVRMGVYNVFRTRKGAMGGSGRDAGGYDGCAGCCTRVIGVGLEYCCVCGIEGFCVLERASGVWVQIGQWEGLG
jgi:hypothetical protein